MPAATSPRPLIIAALVILVVVIGYLLLDTPAPEIAAPAPTQKSKPAAQTSQPGFGSSPATTQPSPSKVYIDPTNLAKADQLNAPDRTAQDDLQIVTDFIGIYRTAYGGNPIGQNEDITAALTGNAGQTGRVFPPNSPAIRNGQLTDRWGSPYWFHPQSGFKMEIRSRGPDKELFTADDIIFNP